MGDVANKDEAFKCIDIARAALKAGEHARAEKFAAKALKLYRCSQVRQHGSCFVTEEQLCLAAPWVSRRPLPFAAEGITCRLRPPWCAVSCSIGTCHKTALSE